MNYGIIGTYKGDSFKNLIRLYSYDRMNRDRQYRSRVLEIITGRKENKDAKPTADNRN